MKVVFRADASRWMGTGHLMRCLSLAEALRERGADVRFICRDHAGSMLELVRQRAFPFVVLPTPEGRTPIATDDYEGWLGVSQAADAEETLQALRGMRPDWLIMDHYGLDQQWEALLKPHVGRLMVIDDLANRSHACDLLLDQNFDNDPQRYRRWTPARCQELLGPQFAVIRPVFLQFRQTWVSRDGSVKRILIFFGGSDGSNMTGRTLEALSVKEFAELEIDVVVGSNHSHRAEIERLVAARPRTHFFGQRPHLADLMTEADLAVGAGGTTTWERMCLALPAITFSISENQVPACNALSDARLIRYLGHHTEFKGEELRTAVRELIASPKVVLNLAEAGAALVDGRGAHRVAEALFPTKSEDYVLTADSAQSFSLRARGLRVATLAFSEEERSGNARSVQIVADSFVPQSPVKSRLLASGLQLMNELVSPFWTFDRNPSRPSSRSYAIAILSDANSWINAAISEFVLELLGQGHRILWVHDAASLKNGDFCFYLSCTQIVPREGLELFAHNLVVHESELPKGKGWSPLTWQVLEGAARIPVTLFEASVKVDSGPIYAQRWIELRGTELLEELRSKQAEATFELCRSFIKGFPDVAGRAQQQQGEASYYRRRTSEDSRIDLQQSLAAQFNLLRVVDNERYPATFEWLGRKYRLAIRPTEDSTV